jgi:flagellin
MSVTANTNIPSIAASRSLYEARSDMSQAMERLSSGKRINSAGDDAAGASVVSKMRAQIASLNQSVRNANDGLSWLNTYEGASQEIEDILIRIRELATLSASGTYTNDDRANADLEVTALVAEITRIKSQTLFNGTVDVASAAGANIAVQMGFGATDKVTFTLSALDTGSLSLDATKGIGTAASAALMITEADEALTQLAENRAMAGAAINRLEHTVSNLMNVVQRTEEARSRIEDADFASESAALARANVLTQAGTAMLAQANQSPQYLLALLR